MFCHEQVPNWSRLGRLKRSKFPSLAGGGHTFGGGAGAGVMTVLAGMTASYNPPPTPPHQHASDRPMPQCFYNLSSLDKRAFTHQSLS